MRLNAKSLDAKGLYERIAIRDVQECLATICFKPVYQQFQAPRRFTSDWKFIPLLRMTHQGQRWKEAKAAVESSGRENLISKGAGHAEGIPGHPASSWRGAEHQYHAAVCAIGI